MRMGGGSVALEGLAERPGGASAQRACRHRPAHHAVGVHPCRATAAASAGRSDAGRVAAVGRSVGGVRHQNTLAQASLRSDQAEAADRDEDGELGPATTSGVPPAMRAGLLASRPAGPARAGGRPSPQPRGEGLLNGSAIPISEKGPGPNVRREHLAADRHDRAPSSVRGPTRRNGAKPGCARSAVRRPMAEAVGSSMRKSRSSWRAASPAGLVFGPPCGARAARTLLGSPRGTPRGPSLFDQTRGDRGSVRSLGFCA